jgi:hypothetical protein
MLDDISGIKYLKELEHFSYKRFYYNTIIDIPIIFENLKTIALKNFYLNDTEIYSLYPFLCSNSLEMFEVDKITHSSLIDGICNYYDIDSFTASQNWIKYCKMYVTILHRNKQLEELID